MANLMKVDRKLRFGPTGQ